MKLAEWDPFRELENVLDRYSRAVRWPLRSGQEAMATEDWAPRLDIVETDKAFCIKAEIPEVKKEDVKVTVENGVLILRGERKQEKEERTRNFTGSSDITAVLPEVLRFRTMWIPKRSKPLSRMGCWISRSQKRKMAKSRRLKSS